MVGSLNRLAALLLLSLLAGCTTPEKLAKRLTTAPNQQFHFLTKRQTDQWLQSLAGTNSYFQKFTVPVGPPDAELAVMELPAADYHVRVISKITRGAHDSKMLVVDLSRTNAAVTPLPERGVVVVLHGYLTQKETMLPWAFVLAQSGYRVVLVDLRGHGASTGRVFSGGKYETADMMQVLDSLAARHLAGANVGVLGYSFGADLALYWAARDPRVKTVVAIGAYDEPEEALVRLVRDLKLRIKPAMVRQAAGMVETNLDMKWSDWDGAKSVRRIQEPILLIGGGKDSVSPPGDFLALKQACPPGSRGIMIPDANHEVILLWLHELAGPVKDWFDEHLPPQ